MKPKRGKWLKKDTITNFIFSPQMTEKAFWPESRFEREKDETPELDFDHS